MRMFHTTRAAVGEKRSQNCTLRRMEAELVRGAEVPKPPHERGGPCCSHKCVAAAQTFIFSTASAVMKDWGDLYLAGPR